MSDEFVYVAVPRHLAAKIYRHIADLVESDPTSMESKGIAGGLAAKLSPELSAALTRRMYKDSHEPHRRLMRFLAEAPDTWFSTEELAHALQLEHGAKGMAGMLGAFGRRAKHRYGGRTPWESRWDGVHEKAFHRMRPTVAEAVQAAAKEYDAG